MNERYIQYHLDVSEIADKLNEVLQEYALVDYHILRDEKTINKYRKFHFQVISARPIFQLPSKYYPIHLLLQVRIGQKKVPKLKFRDFHKIKLFKILLDQNFRSR